MYFKRINCVFYLFVNYMHIYKNVIKCYQSIICIAYKSKKLTDLYLLCSYPTEQFPGNNH